MTSHGAKEALGTTSGEESGRRSAQGRREGQWQDWSPWPASPAADRPTQPVTSYEMRPANREANPWTNWTKEVQASRPERIDDAQWRTDVSGTYALNQSWSSSGSGWNGSTTWSAPTSSNLIGPDYSTDRECYESRRGYTPGWANDSSYWYQSKRAQPTRTDPEDDRQTDSAMPSGSTSKTWSPA